MTEILSLNASFGKRTVADKIDTDVLVINPENAAALVAPELWNRKNFTVTNDVFSEIAQKTKNLQRKIKLFKEKNSLVIVFLQPPQYIFHERHRDVVVGNYDWLDLVLEQKRDLKILSVEAKEYAVTEHGIDTPFGALLQENKQKVSVIAQGNFTPLAIIGPDKMASFFFKYGQSKIIFLPSFLAHLNREKLNSAFVDALNPELWPGNKVIPTELSWTSSYTFPEEAAIEKIICQKQLLIQRLESQCDNLYHQLFQVEEIQKNLFKPKAESAGHAVASIMGQWGIEICPGEEIFQLTSGKRKGVVLMVVCSEKAALYNGKKLLGLCKEGQKGIMIINAYCHQDIQKRPNFIASKSLEEFAVENNLALVSIVDIYKTHCLGRKELIDKIWNQKGVVVPPYQLWENEVLKAKISSQKEESKEEEENKEESKEEESKEEEENKEESKEEEEEEEEEEENKQEDKEESKEEEEEEEEEENKQESTLQKENLQQETSLEENKVGENVEISEEESQKDENSQESKKEDV